MLITIVGPTASGKTALGARLARCLSSEVLSADSRQVYQGMDIGTGKDLKDYYVDGAWVPYHLIDLLPAGEQYNLYRYQHDFAQAYRGIKERGVKHPILCGGTGLYVESVLRQYNLSEAPENPELRRQLEGLSLAELRERLKGYPPIETQVKLDTAQRIIRAIEMTDYAERTGRNTASLSPAPELEPALIFCLDLEREERRSRITKRLKARLNEGMIDEVKGLIDQGVPTDMLISYGLEYRFITLYLLEQMSYTDMVQELEIAIHQFAKRQMTWFRGMERRGLTLHYLNALASHEELIDTITATLKG